MIPATKFVETQRQYSVPEGIKSKKKERTARHSLKTTLCLVVIRIRLQKPHTQTQEAKLGNLAPRLSFHPPPRQTHTQTQKRDLESEPGRRRRNATIGLSN